MDDLDEKIMNAFEEKPIWLKYINGIFFIMKHRRNWKNLEKFLNKLNSFHLTTKFTAKYSKETIIFLYLNIRLVGRAHERFSVKPTNTHPHYLDSSSFHTFIGRKEYHLVKLKA